MQMQTQTNPMNPQGLASLMKGMPQGQPNPLQPTPATPGSVNQIKNTYGTNTVPRDLKALMALNEALQMVQSANNNAQLQAQVPQESVKDQMTSAAQGILQQAQGVAGASQQQEQQKQAMLQRMMQGVAGAPGAGQVMPTRMAMGGVVAFQNMGEVPDPEAMALDELRVAEARRRREMAQLQDKLNFLQRANAPREQIQAVEQRMTEISGGQTSPVAPQAQPRPPVARPAPVRPPGAPAGLPTVPVQRPVLSTVGQGITLPGATAPQRDVAPQLGAGEQGSALPMGMQQAPQEDPMKSILGQVNPEAIAKAAGERAKVAYGMSDEEKRIYEERLARMRKEAAPKDTRWYERLGDLAARYANRPVQGTNVGALGGIASVGAELGKERLTEQQRRQAEIDALQEKFLGAQSASRKGIFEAEEAARRLGMEQQAKIGAIGADVLGTQTRAGTEAAGIAARTKEGELDRQSRERIAQLDAATREKIARMEASARAGDQQIQREIQRINAAMNDPRLKKLGELAAASPDRYQTQYETAVEEALKRVAPGLYGKKPPPAGGTAKPDDPLGIRK